jgi:glutathione S-transferase
MKIYGDTRSGNCYKLKLLCALLSIEHEWISVDILRGESRSDAFLKMNPNGQIPVCITDDDVIVTQSNAILYYLGQGSDYWPDNRLEQTRVLEWQFFEQYTHEPTIAVARFIKLYQGMPADRQDEYHDKLKAGYRALEVMENHLQQHEYLATNRISLADISLYAYTHVAHEGGFDLSSYPALEAWISRVQSQPAYVAMDG